MDFKEEKIVIGDGHVAIHDWAPVDRDGHHKNSNEIEHDIDETRHTMDILFDTLTNRLHPRTMVDQFLDRFQLPENRRKAQDMLLNTGKRISDSFQENPVPLLLIGVGAALLLLERRGAPAPTERTGGKFQEKTGEFAQNASQAASEKIAQAKENIKAGGEKLRDTFQTGKERVSESVERARQTGQERLSQGKEYGYSWQDMAAQKYRDTGGTVSHMIQERPLAVGIAAAMFGMVLGILFPETKTEQQAMGPSARETFKKAQEKEQEMVERGKQVAEETSKTAYEKAKEKGLTPDAAVNKNKEEVSGTQPTPNVAPEREVKETTKTVYERLNEKGLTPGTFANREEEKKTEQSKPDISPKENVEKAVHNKVSPELGKTPLDLKEKKDEKIGRKDLPDKPLA